MMFNEKRILRRCQAFAGTDNTDTIMRIATMKRAAMLFVVLLLNVHVYAQLDKAVKKILCREIPLAKRYPHQTVIRTQSV